jgi:hypothetical protein
MYIPRYLGLVDTRCRSVTFTTIVGRVIALTVSLNLLFLGSAPARPVQVILPLPWSAHCVVLHCLALVFLLLIGMGFADGSYLLPGAWCWWETGGKLGSVHGSNLQPASCASRTSTAIILLRMPTNSHRWFMPQVLVPVDRTSGIPMSWCVSYFMVVIIHDLFEERYAGKIETRRRHAAQRLGCDRVRDVMVSSDRLRISHLIPQIVHTTSFMARLVTVETVGSSPELDGSD